jgi:hypothetical protein
MFLVTGGGNAREAVLNEKFETRDEWTGACGSSYLLFNFPVLFFNH